MADLLAKASPYLLLLSATPHSGKTEPFLHLLRLLDEQAFHILSVARQAERQFPDAKAEHLLDLLDRLYAKEPGRKVIIFTEAYKKYLYALDLRLEAAERIGIENIKKRRIASIRQEKEKMQAEYAYKSKLCPVFKPVFLAFME